MAGFRVEVVLVGLLLLSVQGWRRIDDPAKLFSLYEAGKLPQAGSFAWEDADVNDNMEQIPEDELAAISNGDRSADHGVHMAHSVSDSNDIFDDMELLPGKQLEVDVASISNGDSSADHGFHMTSSVSDAELIDDMEQLPEDELAAVSNDSSADDGVHMAYFVSDAELTDDMEQLPEDEHAAVSNDSSADHGVHMAYSVSDAELTDDMEQLPEDELAAVSDDSSADHGVHMAYSVSDGDHDFDDNMEELPEIEGPAISNGDTTADHIFNEEGSVPDADEILNDMALLPGKHAAVSSDSSADHQVHMAYSVSGGDNDFDDDMEELSVVEGPAISNGDATADHRFNEEASVPDANGIFDDYMEELPEFEAAAVGNGDSSADHGLNEEHSVSSNLTSDRDDQLAVELKEAPPRSWPSSPSQGSKGLAFVCGEHGYQMTLHTGRLQDIQVLGPTDVLYVVDAPESCGYVVNTYRRTFTVPFSGCHVTYSIQTNRYRLDLLYIDEYGQTQSATAVCDHHPYSHQPYSHQPYTHCHDPPPPQSERVTCGVWGISSANCQKLGCCVDPSSSACYYPLDECTLDHHFVFAIRYDSASVHVDPTKLVIAGHPHCKPVFVNSQVAIFKFKVTECGVRAFHVGQTKVYLADVRTVAHSLNLKYGAVTWSDPLRFLIECRYNTDGNSHSLASLGYMVKTPTSTLPSSITSLGLYFVQLRIATDHTYTRYMPTFSPPLRLLLGKPIYLELKLNPVQPLAVILVNYCLAYPLSANNALVLVYEGCANPYDTSMSILKVDNASVRRNVRRLKVTAFQFMDQTTNKYLDEEIYFMCSAEVCFPSEKTCAEQCFDGRVPPHGYHSKK